ncbi:phosphoribosyltransferase [Aestuariibacter halophilus]|uniref:Phosphoribosyltransferase n=1 Tax=Fluctibacter halophilus TaxID=226011 RepID=A0ABS8G914_9ALTE|nr:phosphoribosyltransferase [Aestuariibacter halophilus]MCC2615691.1 phosphoribosyltransferase [Aestuariibacter halophilus]
MDFPFRDRLRAGQLLAEELKRYRRAKDTLILALPRGGVPVGCELALALGLPFDMLSVRKLTVPGEPELAMGAIASGDVVALNDDIIAHYGVKQSDIDQAIAREKVELNRRQAVYRGDKPFPELEGKTVILVDDGIATGATIKAAIRALHSAQPRSVIVAVPVGCEDALPDIRALADELVCLHTPVPFVAVGCWYNEFPQASDQTVLQHLSRVWTE